MGRSLRRSEMGASKTRLSQRPRELRRRVVLPARLRAGAQWSDTCILNISSRGLMIHSGRPAPKGTQVELHRSDHVIIARVMWRDGAKVGLQAEERLPVQEIVSAGQSRTLRVTAFDGARVERRQPPRSPAGDARLRGRVMEFIAVSAIAATLAISVWAMAQQALARPMAQVANALSDKG
jgi:hypothetical protein